MHMYIGDLSMCYFGGIHVKRRFLECEYLYNIYTEFGSYPSEIYLSIYIQEFSLFSKSTMFYQLLSLTLKGWFSS